MNQLFVLQCSTDSAFTSLATVIKMQETIYRSLERMPMDASQVTQTGRLLDATRGIGERGSSKLPRLARIGIIGTLAALSWLVVGATPFIF